MQTFSRIHNIYSHTLARYTLIAMLKIKCKYYVVLLCIWRLFADDSVTWFFGERASLRIASGVAISIEKA